MTDPRIVVGDIGMMKIPRFGKRETDLAQKQMDATLEELWESETAYWILDYKGYFGSVLDRATGSRGTLFVEANSETDILALGRRVDAFDARRWDFMRDYALNRWPYVAGVVHMNIQGEGKAQVYGSVAARDVTGGKVLGEVVLGMTNKKLEGDAGASGIAAYGAVDDGPSLPWLNDVENLQAMVGGYIDLLNGWIAENVLLEVENELKSEGCPRGDGASGT